MTRSLPVALLFAAAAASAQAARHAKFLDLLSITQNGVIAQCPTAIANATLALPTAGNVEVNAGDVVEGMALGLGKQNYVCKNNNWILTGVTATLYDISCQYNASSISALSTAFNGLAANAVSALPADKLIGGALGDTLNGVAGRTLNKLGRLTSTDGTNYLIDFRRSKGGALDDATAYSQGAVYASQAAPVQSYDVDWLRINTASGSLAKEVFQVQTAGGWPLTQGLACDDGATDAAPFSAQYWLYKDNVAANSKVAQAATCDVATTKAAKAMVVLTTAVQYGATGVVCTSIVDCTTKCFANKNCIGFSLSTEDGEGYTKLKVFSNKLGYAQYFTSGIVRKITNKQYVTRQGEIEACPAGQITSADYLGCVVPTCAAEQKVASSIISASESSPTSISVSKSEDSSSAPVSSSSSA